MDFQPLDIVVLNSGGPDMPVIQVDENGQVECWWMDDTGETDSNFFAPECLRLA